MLRNLEMHLENALLSLGCSYKKRQTALFLGGQPEVAWYIDVGVEPFLGAATWRPRGVCPPAISSVKGLPSHILGTRDSSARLA